MKLRKILSLILSALVLLSVTSGLTVTSFAATVDEILFEENFDDYDIDTYTNAELVEKNEKADIAETWTGGFEVKQTTSGKKYLSVYEPTTVNTTNGYKTSLAERFTQGTLIVEMKVLPQQYNTASYGYKLLQLMGKLSGSDTQTSYPILNTNYGNNLLIAAGLLNSYATYPQNDPTADSDGFWNLRLIYSRKTTNDDWTLAVYDGANGKVIAQQVTIAKAAGPDITRIDFIDMYAMSNSTNTRSINITDLKVYKPKDVTFTQKSAYDTNDKKVVFEASEKLLSGTVNEETITILSPSGDDITGVVSLDENGKDIIITFPYGLPQNGTYSVSANGVQTERNVTADISVNFEGTKTIIPFALASVSPVEGIISAQQKTITISFTTEPDDSLLDKVTFKKADGGDIPGLYETEVSGKNVIVSFDKLNPGDYVLTVDSEFADKEDGTTLGENCILNYTVKEPKPAGDNYQGDAFVTGTEYTAQELMDMSENVSYGSSGRYTIEESDGDKFVTLRTFAPHTGATAFLVMPEAVTDGVLEANVKIKGSGDTLARNLLRVQSEAGNVYLLSMNNGTDITLSTNANNAGGEFSDDAPEEDADGFFSLKLRMTAGSSSEDWLIEIFDTSYLGERLFYSSTVSREKLSDITQILIAEIWPVSESETERSVSISEMWFNHSEFVSVSEAPASILPTDETLVFKMDDDVSAEGMEVKLVSGDNKEVKCTYTYSEIERKLYVKPESFLKWSETYTLKAEGAGIKPYTFVVSDAPCTVTQKTITPIPQQGSFNATATVSVNAPSGREIMIVLSGYDEKGYPIKLSNNTVVASGGVAQASVTLEGLTAEKCKELQCFIWEKTDFGYRIIK